MKKRGVILDEYHAQMIAKTMIRTGLHGSIGELERKAETGDLPEDIRRIPKPDVFMVIEQMKIIAGQVDEFLKY